MSTWQKVAIAAAVGLGGGLLFWKWSRTLKKVSNVYETESFVNQYMAFHYATQEEYFPYRIGPRDHTDFPKRCAELCVQYKSVRSLAVLCMSIDLEAASRFDV
jgi:hypothetical protein